ncbi:MAG: type II secretion system protein [Nannocystaceae bacterium]|nr:type II secretion system protein [Nannocystaceae bacterium]
MRASQRGMTLIEILIVIGVLGLMLSMVVIGFSSGRNAETSRKVNQVANLVRYGYDKARVTGQHYRMLVDFENKFIGLQEGDGRMYLPATDRDGKLVAYDESKAEQPAKRDERAEQSFNQSVQAEIVGGAGAAGDGEASYEDALDPYKPHPRKVPRRKPPLFQRFEDDNALPDLAQKIEFGDNFKIVSVRTAEDLQPIESGTASIYFFPRGRTQQTHIQIQDKEGENLFTIKVAPLTGRVTIVDGHEDLEVKGDPSDELDELGNRSERRTF